MKVTETVFYDNNITDPLENLKKVTDAPVGDDWLVSRKLGGAYCGIYKDDRGTTARNPQFKEYTAIGGLVRFLSCLPSGFALLGKLCVVKDGVEDWEVTEAPFLGECELADYRFYVYDALLLEEMLGEDTSPTLTERMARLTDIWEFLALQEDRVQGLKLCVAPLMKMEPNAVELLEKGGREAGWDGILFRRDVPHTKTEAQYISFKEEA